MAERRIETRPIDDYPSNSKMYTPSSVEKKPGLRKVSGKTVKPKRSFGRRIFESFAGADLNTITNHVLDEIIIPEFKDALLDGLESGLEAFFGRKDTTRSTARRQYNYSGYNYERPSWGGRQNYISSEYRPSHVHSEAWNATTMPPQFVENRDEAYGLLNDMGDQIEQFGYVTVEDVKSAFGVTALSTDLNYGWRDMEGNRVRRYNGGYLVEFAPAIYLK